MLSGLNFLSFDVQIDFEKLLTRLVLIRVTLMLLIEFILDGLRCFQLDSFYLLNSQNPIQTFRPSSREFTSD